MCGWEKGCPPALFAGLLCVPCFAAAPPMIIGFIAPDISWDISWDEHSAIFGSHEAFLLPIQVEKCQKHVQQFGKDWVQASL